MCIALLVSLLAQVWEKPPMVVVTVQGVQVLLVTHMGDVVSNNGGDNESSSNAVGRRPVIMVRNL